MAASSAQRHPLLRTKDIEALPEEARVHALDSRSVRHTRSLGDAVGLGTIGVHLVRLEQGRTSSVHHFHHHDEEWVYILSGHGMAEIGDEKFEVGAGDFMGFVAGSLPHNLFNPNAEDLVYLVGGNRLPFDVCDYPRARMRRYRTNGVNEYVKIKTGTKAPQKNRNESPKEKRERKPEKKKRGQKGRGASGLTASMARRKSS